MSEQTGQDGQSRYCPSCGAQVPAQARYCPSCGARLPEPVGGPSFEEAIADVLDEPESGSVPPPSEPSYGPTIGGEWQPESSPPPPVTPPPWSTTAPPAGGWGQSTLAPPPMVEAPGNRWLWIVLAVFGFLTFCCCGLAFIGLMVDSSS